MRARARQGDRAAQPPRLVELPLLPLLRARVELPALRRGARAAPRAAASWPATTAATASRVPARCGDCSSTSVARHGAGTERLRTSSRASSTTAASRSSASTPTSSAASATPASGGDPRARALLRRFEAAECGVLIGTQMVAKGHDFPDVTLGVVLDADATLRFPDFRAEERTFALIAQLAGRVGRGGEGRVLVQTIAPEARAIVHAAAPRQRRLPRRRARAPPRARLPAVLAPDQDRLLGRGVRGRARCRVRRCASCSRRLRARRPATAGARGGRRPCSARRRCFACAAASARCSWSRRPSAARRGGGRRRGRPRRRRGRRHAGVSFSVDVDPQ